MPRTKKKVVNTTKHKVSFHRLPWRKRTSEINGLPSETIPNQSMTVNELLEKHVQGLSDPTLVKEGIYDENPDHDSDPTFKARTRLELIEEAHEADEIIQQVERLSENAPAGPKHDRSSVSEGEGFQEQRSGAQKPQTRTNEETAPAGSTNEESEK